MAKKAYNEEQRKLENRKNLLPGNDWYSQQAYQAISQALGRCIRHAADYGTIILLDSRHCDDGSPGFTHSKLPQWMRNHVRNLSMPGRTRSGSNPILGGYKGLAQEMESFFQQAPAHVQTVTEQMQLDFEKAREREKRSAGHQFNRDTGSWTQNTGAD